MKIKHKSFPIKIEIKEDASGARTVEGYASTFGNKDSDNDIVLKGAFMNSLKARMPKMLWQHNTTQPIGVWESAQETDKGLYVKGRLLNTTLGNDAYELAKGGAIDSMSIGYTVNDANMDWDSGTRSIKEVDLWEVSLVTFPANTQANITMVKAMADDMEEMAECLDKAMSLCQAYMSGQIAPTAEAFATVHDLLGNMSGLIMSGEDDEDDGSVDKDAKRVLSPKQIERVLREAGMSRWHARGVLAKGAAALSEVREASTDESEIKKLFKQFT